MSPRRQSSSMLRRERRALLEAREEKLRDLGGLMVELYRRGTFRDDLVAEGCAAVVGLDARLAEIAELLEHGRRVPRCDCGSPIFSGSRFCPSCGRAIARAGEAPAGPDGTGG